MKIASRFIWPVLFIALVVRLVFLSGSFWMDEAAQVLESARPFQEQFHIPYDFQPPLFHVLVHGMYQISQTEMWLRLVSLVSGLMTIYITFLIARDFFVTKKGEQSIFIGLLSALLLSISGFHIYFSQELRPYSLATLWAVFSWYALLKAVTFHQKKWWISFVISTIAGVYSMYIYPFLVLGQCFWVATQKRQEMSNLLKSLCVVALAFLPWIPAFLEQLRIGSELRGQLPGWSDIVSTPVWKAFPMTIAKFVGGMLPIDANVQTLLMVGIPLLVVVLILAFGFTPQRKQHSAFIFFITAWFVVPVLFALLVTIVLPVLSPKRVLFVLPAWCLAISYAFAQITLKWKWWLISTFIFAQCVGVLIYWRTPALQREQWKQMSSFLHQQFTPENTIIVMGWYEQFPSWAIYANQENKSLRVLPVASVRTVIPSELDQRLAVVKNYSNVLVFDYMRDLTDPTRSIETWLEKHGYRGVDSIDTQNFGFIRYYVRQSMLGRVDSINDFVRVK